MGHESKIEFAGDDVDTLVVDLVELSGKDDTRNECDESKPEHYDTFTGWPETAAKVLFRWFDGLLCRF